MAKVLKTLKKKAQATPVVGVILDSFKSENPTQNAPSIQAVLNNLRPKQLLVNPDFQVNQRGQSSYINNTSTPTYTLDMWQLAYGTLSVLENGVKVTPYATQVFLNQKIDYDLTDKQVTLILKETNGEMHILQGVASKTQALSVKSGNVTLSIGYISETNLYKIGTTYDAETSVEYINLFEGDIAYPHVKNKYADDLMECQEKTRYIVKALRQYLTFGIGVYYDGSIYMDTSIRNFASGGTVTFAGTYTLFAIKGKENIELVTINSCVFDNLTGYLSVKFSNMNNLQNGDVFLIQTSSLGAFINVSCEPL